MGSLRFSDFGDSPAMIVSPHQHSFGPVASYHSSLQHYHSFKPAVPVDPSPAPYFQPATHVSTRLESIAPTSGSKRKRDSFEDESITAPILEQLEGKSFTAAGAQTNWRTDPTNTDTVAMVCENLEPRPEYQPSDALPSRQKFRRRETNDTLSLTTFNNTIIPATPNPKTQEQAIDQFTHLLGVGWTRIASSSCPNGDLQKATRGWEKYIENHYPLTSVAILASSKALDGAFLTLARDYENMALRRFLLFKEDLTEGRLIASDWGTCLARLQSSPITFEYEEALRAQRTPDLTPMTEASAEVDKPDGMEDLAALPPLPLDDGTDDAMACD